jgi:hypothetical protein
VDSNCPLLESYLRTDQTPRMGAYMNFDLQTILVPFLFAVAADIVRVKVLLDEQLKNLNSDSQNGVVPKLRFPPKYWLFSILYGAVASLLGTLLPEGSSVLVLAYIGLSLPKFVELIAKTAEPLIPGQFQSANSPGVDQVDSSSMGNPDDINGVLTPLVSTRSGRIRKRFSVYGYLAG